jgi:HD-GYP domain-containing protein (c-di-GMP phosphodiesterase class II)
MSKKSGRVRRTSLLSSRPSARQSLQHQLRDLREWKRRLMLLLEFGKRSTAETNLDRLLELLIQEAKMLLGADRATVFLLDKKRRQLWSRAASGTDVIRVPMDKGISGHVVVTGKALNISDAYHDARFNPEVDRQTGYRTRSVLAVPMRNNRAEVIGVFQVLNQRRGSFIHRDEELLTVLAGQAAASTENAQLYEQLYRASRDTILRLAAAAEFRDKETHAHLERMSHYSAIIAEEMGFPKSWVENLRLASPLHDIGKIGVPDAVLRKPGKLNEEEWHEMKKHTLYGAEILKDSDNELIQMSQKIALSHHEWWNGQGYPHGLKGREIPIEARIATVADVFDALTSRRVYKPSFSLEETLDLLRKDSGVRYDPQVIEVFLKALPRVTKVMAEYARAGHPVTDGKRTAPQAKSVAPLWSRVIQSVRRLPSVSTP